eukprot:TRINITY_DN12190_c0_g1_i1.p1 TRINITY_DN12190_c0_g1~~TRINITY_DN12190_c0_g1_i1.p1  ORF type:complete len:395 (-),score=61.79 TRINITY_DN12190_c0_g1_i1:17-1201(-)
MMNRQQIRDTIDAFVRSDDQSLLFPNNLKPKMMKEVKNRVDYLNGNPNGLFITHSDSCDLILIKHHPGPFTMFQIPFRARISLNKEYKTGINTVKDDYFEYVISQTNQYFGYQQIIDDFIEMWLDQEWYRVTQFNAYRTNIINQVSKHFQTKAGMQTLEDIDAIKEQYTYDTLGLNHDTLYTKESEGNYYISIDMNSANFQTLSIFDPDIVDGAETYDDFLNSFTTYNYFKKCKPLRQYLLGIYHSNAQRQILLYYTYQLASVLLEQKINIEMIRGDEIIIKLEDTSRIKNMIERLHLIIDENSPYSWSVQAFFVETMDYPEEFKSERSDFFVVKNIFLDLDDFTKTRKVFKNVHKGSIKHIACKLYDSQDVTDIDYQIMLLSDRIYSRGKSYK